MKALMLQIVGRVELLEKSAPNLLYRLVVHQVDHTPSRADLVDKVLERFSNLLSEFNRLPKDDKNLVVDTTVSA
jgi:hypothetical protein